MNGSICFGTAALLLLAGTPPLHAMTITVQAPCNVLVAGRPAVFSLGDAKSNAHYTITDYFSNQVAKGEVAVTKGTGTLRCAGFAPGAYELVFQSGTDSASALFCVVMDRGKAPMPHDGRVGVDAAAAWLVKPDSGRKPVAKALGLAGIPWVRERLSWVQTEPEPGKFEWGRYQETADLLWAEGIHICQIFHDVPERLHPGSQVFLFPSDLRDLYKYSKTAAKHFERQIQAWEVFNESDICWALLGDTFAAMQKVQYLGIKAGNPNALVLQTSFSHITYQALPIGPQANGGAGMFARNIYDCGAGDYFDAFNWHTYLDYGDYAKMMDSYRKLMSEQGVSEHPAWLTEVGYARPAPTEGPLKGFHDSMARHEQCDYLPKSITMALASGTEKYFWFVLPDYQESERQFALLRPDLVANPSFGALSAAANILGLAEYLGELKTEGTEVHAYLFSTPKGNVISVWADKETRIAIPTEKATVTIADMFGKTNQIAAKDGAVTLRVVPQQRYLVDVGRAVEAKVVNERPRREKPAVCRASSVVLAGYCGLGVDRGAGVYVMSENREPFVYTVETYQFDEKNGAEGTVEVIAPTGWRIENAVRKVKLEPMGREVLKFTVTPAPTAGNMVKLKAIGRFTSPPVAPSVSYIRP